MTPARRSTDASATSLPIPAGIWLARKCTLPTSKIAMAHLSYLPRSAISFLGCAMFLPTVPTPAKSWRLLSLGMASGPSPSSSDRTRPRVFRCCHDAGWSSEPSPGSAATGGWPRTSKGPSRAARRGFILLPCSCWRAALLAHPQPLQVNYYYKQLLRFLTRHLAQRAAAARQRCHTLLTPHLAVTSHASHVEIWVG